MTSVFNSMRTIRQGIHPARSIKHSQTQHTQWKRTLEGVTSLQSKFVAELQAAWRSENREGVLRLLEHNVEEYFDPECPGALLGLVGCGGLDALVTILLSDAQWFFARNYQRDDIRAISSYNTIIRVLTELIVVDNSMGWYLFDAYPGLIHRLIRLLPVKKLQESCIMLLEHTMSTVGPVVDIGGASVFKDLLRKSDDSTLASLCRVLALMLVAGAMSEQSTCNFKLEEFPQCITRLRAVENQVKRNADMILAQPNLVERLVKLCEVEADGIRIFHGNRTMTVMAPGENAPAGSTPLVNFGDGEGVEQGEYAIEDFLAQLQATNANLFGGGAGAANADPGQSLMQMLQNIMNPPQAPQTGSVLQMQTLQQAIAAANTNGSQTAAVQMPVPAPDPNAPAGEQGNNTLQQVANSIGQELPAANALDSIDFAWFVGKCESKSRWRLRKMTIDDEEDTRYRDFGFSTKQAQKASEDAMVKYIEESLAQTRQDKQQEERVNKQAIVNSQSEVLFVLNSLLASRSFTEVWLALTEIDILPRFLQMFNTMFFINAGPTSVNVEGSSPPKPRRTTGDGIDELERMDTLVDEDDPNHRHDPDTLRKIELVRAIHEYWNAQDRHEMRRLMSIRPDCRKHLPELAMKVVQQITSGKEDPCSETLASHALEGYLRALPFSDRDAETYRISVESGFMEHVLRRRIFEFVGVVGEYNSLFPLKRTEGMLTVVGESCRYSNRCLGHFNKILAGVIDFRHHTDTFEIPSAATIQTPKRDVTFKTVLSKVAHRFPFDVNLFLRGLVLTTISGLRSWKNVIVPPTMETLRTTWPHEDDAIKPMPTSLRKAEQSATQLSRLYYVKKHSREYVEMLYDLLAVERKALSDPSAKPHMGSCAGRSAVCDMRPLIDLLTHAPGSLPLEERPHPTVFFDVELDLVKGGEDHPPKLHRLCDPALNKETRSLFCFPPATTSLPPEQSESPAPEPGYFYEAASFPAVTEFLDENIAMLVYRIATDVEAQDMESTEKLCAITTTNMLFLREYVRAGEQGIVDLLEAIVRVHTDADTMLDRTVPTEESSLKAKCREHKRNTNPELAHNCCAAMSIFDERHRLDNPGRDIFLKKTDDGTLKGRALYDPKGLLRVCPFVNLFQLLCVWIAHYSSCQRYIETLFYCTQVPFYEWKTVALLILKHVPRYFTFSQGE